MEKLTTLFLAGCLVLLVAFPCAAGEVVVAAAASLKEAMDELVDGFARDHRGTIFVRNYGASGTLARQIAAGAPVDLFVSSSPEWMDDLSGKDLIATATKRIFAGNTLVFVGLPGKAKGMADLARLERIAIGSPKSVPAGDYALEAMKRAGLAPLLLSKLVMARDVREGLVYAERGVVDGAFVYNTDALLSRRVGILFSVPPELYPPIVYPLALTVSGAKNPDAIAFNGYLRGQTAQDILQKYGFVVP